MRTCVGKAETTRTCLTHRVTSTQPESPGSPATWENVLVGEMKEAVGHITDNHDLAEDGEAQKNVAYELRKKWTDERRG